MTPSLSIIIPCYNYGHYLPETLDSILQQDYTDYELVLVDDGSTDSTWQILQEYADRYETIHLLKNAKNIGLFKSNQRGLNKAKGRYIHFFACDDLYNPGVLSKMMGLFKSDQTLGLICSDINYLNEDQKIIIKPLLPTSTCARIFQPKELMALFQKTNFWIPGTTCIIKKELLDKYGFLNPELENISDWFFFHKIALLEGIGYLPDSFVTMRLHSQTYTNQVKKDKKRRYATYLHLFQLLSKDPSVNHLFKRSGLLSFIFREMGWKIRLKPKYFKYLPYLKR